MDSDQCYDGDPDDEVSPLLRLNLDCLYYNIDDMVKFTQLGNNYKYTSIHLNIHSLSSKYNQLRTMIANLKDIGMIIHFIMLCETFLMDSNKDMFSLPGYQFICNNRVHGRGGGVALYVRDIFQINIRNDLTVNRPDRRLLARRPKKFGELLVSLLEVTEDLVPDGPVSVSLLPRWRSHLLLWKIRCSGGNIGFGAPHCSTFRLTTPPPPGGLHVVSNPRLINLFPSRPRLRLQQPFIPLIVRHLWLFTDIRPRQIYPAGTLPV